MSWAVDSGLNASWPEWARATWAFSIVFLALVAVALIANGLGVKTSGQLAATASEDERRAGQVLTSGQFATVYAGTILTVILAAFWLERRYRIDGLRSMFGLIGILFLLAGLKQPWWLFFTFRRAGWFSAVENDRVMQVVLGFLGVGMVVLAVLNKVT